MSRTPASLLEQLRQPNPQSAWVQFVKLYTPLIYRWARGTGLPSQDASDLVQDVFLVLVEKMPDFEYDRAKSFRAWLRTVTLNKWRDRCRWISGQPALAGAAETIASNIPDPVWLDEREYRQQLVAGAMDLLESEFQPTTWRAFRECAVAGRCARVVASELGLSVNAVYLARSRVLRRLRQELTGLLD
jgi:RNA polymerase sigma-70 factor (ECF subfamily)